MTKGKSHIKREKRNEYMIIIHPAHTKCFQPWHVIPFVGRFQQEEPENQGILDWFKEIALTKDVQSIQSGGGKANRLRIFIYDFVFIVWCIISVPITAKIFVIVLEKIIGEDITTEFTNNQVQRTYLFFFPETTEKYQY